MRFRLRLPKLQLGQRNLTSSARYLQMEIPLQYAPNQNYSDRGATDNRAIKRNIVLMTWFSNLLRISTESRLRYKTSRHLEMSRGNSKHDRLSLALLFTEYYYVENVEILSCWACIVLFWPTMWVESRVFWLQLVNMFETCYCIRKHDTGILGIPNVR